MEPTNDLVLAVEGMTCEHCVRAVRGALESLPGVGQVDVDLASGQVRVAVDEEADRAAMVAAIEEEGYRVAG